MNLEGNELSISPGAQERKEVFFVFPGVLPDDDDESTEMQWNSCSWLEII